MRKIVILLLVIFATWFLIQQRAEVEAIVATRKSADGRYFLLGIGVILVWVVLTGESYRAIYHALQVNVDRKDMILLALGAIFVNTMTPAGGMGGLALVIAEAKRMNYSSARATIAGALITLFDYISFLCVLVLGWVVLFRRNDLNWAEVVASFILLCIALGLGILIYLGFHSASSFGNLLARLARFGNRVLRPLTRRDLFQVSRAHAFAQDAAEGLSALSTRPRDILYPIGLALVNKGLLILVLGLCFKAFHVPISIGTVIASYSIAYLFTIVSPTPAGIGFSEGFLILIIYTMYIPLYQATNIALLYRGLTFYLPWLVGGFALRALRQTARTIEEKQQSIDKL